MTTRRLLLAVGTPSVIGGAEAWAATIADGLTERGWTIGLLHERLSVPERMPVANGARRFHAVGSVPESVSEFAPELVLVNGLADPRIEAELVSRWRSVLYAHNYYGTCVSGSKRFAQPVIRACMRTLGPACLLHYYPHRCGGLNPRTALTDYHLQEARRHLFPAYRRILIASDHMRKEYQRHGVPTERLIVAPPPPFSVQAAIVAPVPPPPNGRLLFLGRVTELKGLDHLVAAVPIAAQQLGRPLSLTVAGEGPALRAAVHLAKQVGTSLTRTEWVNGAERLRIFQEHEMLVMPSLWPEPWGLSGLEAACLGVPVVAYASGSIPEWLTAGVSGELAPADPPTVRGLADALVRALQNRAHYERLSRGAWETARRHDAISHVAIIDRILQAVLDQ